MRRKTLFKIFPRIKEHACDSTLDWRARALALLSLLHIIKRSVAFEAFTFSQSNMTFVCRGDVLSQETAINLYVDIIAIISSGHRMRDAYDIEIFYLRTPIMVSTTEM